jgi:hypothetical protein
MSDKAANGPRDDAISLRIGGVCASVNAIRPATASRPSHTLRLLPMTET